MSISISAMLPQSSGDYCKYCDTPFIGSAKANHVIELDSGLWFLCDECHDFRQELAE
jgi:RNase P subunit RPR2